MAKLTEVEIKAKCLMATMIPNRRYIAADVETSQAMVLEMIMAGDCEKADGLRASGWLGNSSAVAQWGQKYGYVTKSEAEKDATARALDTLIAASKAAPAAAKPEEKRK